MQQASQRFSADEGQKESPSCGPFFAVHHTAEPEMIRTGADFSFAACAHNVPRTVLIRAQEGSAAMNLFRLGSLGGVIR